MPIYLFAHTSEIVPGKDSRVLLDADPGGFLSEEQLIGDESVYLLSEDGVCPQRQGAAILQVVQHSAQEAVVAEGRGTTD